jgi:membrane-bound serine protease (ClpP class)
MATRVLATLAMVLALAGTGASSPARQIGGPSDDSSHGPVVYDAVVDAIIHPVSAEFMVHTIDAADRAGASLLVFTLRTPGGLVDSTRDIVTRMLAAKTPVAIFVAPSGSRAASAGFILTMAADVAAMAPGTHIGAAHPVGANGESGSETMAKKAAADVAAYVRTLAAGRGRNVSLAEEAVQESRAFTEQEALGASPPLIDVVAADLPDLLRRLDGRSVRRFDGSTVILSTASARLVPVEMSRRQRVLSAIAHPNIAFILLSLGILGLTIELWTPGAILPGVVGAIALLLAFFALQMLPVNGAGLLLILLGLILLALEIKVTSYGALTAGGLTSLVLGAMILIDAPEPELRVSLRVVMPVILGCAAICVFLVRLGVASQRRRPATGVHALVGAAAETLTAIEPGRAGQLRTRGEIWRAISAERLDPGTRVRVIDVEGLTLTVARD